MTFFRRSFFTTHKRTLFALLFGLAFSVTVAYAVPPGSQYNAGETLDPGCAPGDSNCSVHIPISQWDDVTGGINYAGGNVGIGTTTPGTALDVVGEIRGSNLTITGDATTVPAPTNLNAVQTCDAGCGYVADGVTGSPRNYRVYAYKNIGAGRFYSSSYVTLPSNFIDDGSNNPYDVTVSWIAAAGADGYRVLVYDPNYYAANYDYGYDTTSTSFIDDGGSTTVYDSGLSTITPTVSYSNAVTISGNVSIGNFAGNGTNMVIVGNDGILSTQSIPTFAWGSITGTLSSQTDLQGALNGKLNNPGGTTAQYLMGNGALATTAFTIENTDSIFSTGLDLTGSSSVASGAFFVGAHAGYAATNADYSNFLGIYAGSGADNAQYSNFIGVQAGSGAGNASNSNFIGVQAGADADNASYANFMGYFAGTLATNATNSIFIGKNAGMRDNQQNTGSINSAHSIFIGSNAATTSADVALNNTGSADDFSILIGNNTSTGGFSNSIAIGAYATNTVTNQFMIGSTTRPIDITRINGSASTQCTITTGTGIACTSDERLKTDITDLSNTTLDTLLSVRTVNYHWLQNPDSPEQIGFLAQDLEQYFPQLVATDSEGYKSVYYAQMTPILVEAIREMNLKVIDINNLTKDNTWRSAITEWLGSASNGLGNFFAGQVTTKTLCVADDSGATTCLTKGQLDTLLSGGSSTVIINTPPTDPIPDPIPTPTETITTDTSTTDEVVADTPVPEEAPVADPAPTPASETPVQ